MMFFAISVLVLGGLGQAPAQASGDSQAGPVGVGVIGDGLHVREVRATLDGWEAGAQARVSLWRGHTYIRQVRGWKSSSSKEVSGHKFEITTWKISQRFSHRHRLCVEYQGHDEMPCVTIKR
ncbi:hypothetical protein [Streptomyces sp. NPDC053726]|uniref:hypothetical protein n=1 Tax=Streptomyces sp. NPDC053726 TaxID=3365713 RepID=UPI0037CCE810